MPAVLGRGRVIGVALAGVLTGLLATPTTAVAASADESLLLTLTNRARAAVGAPPLALDGPLSSIARQWAAYMASQNNISHNPNLRAQIEAAGHTNWTRTGENVGMGPTVQLIQNALLNSPGHYKNIVEPAFQRVGIGIVVANGTLWVVVNFLTLVSSVPAPTAAAPPPTTPTTTAAATAATAATAPATTRAPATTAPPPAPTTTTAAPTTTTTTFAPPAPTTTLPPPSAGLPLQLALMLQQLKALNAPR